MIGARCIRSVAARRGERREMENGSRVAAKNAIVGVDDGECATDAGRAILSVAVGWTRDPGQGLRRVPVAPGELLVARLVPATHDAHEKRIRHVQCTRELVDKKNTIAPPIY